MEKLRWATPSVSETMLEDELNAVLDELFPARIPRRQGLDLDMEGEQEWNPELEVATVQVRKALRGRKAGNTAPGPDGLTKRLWKTAPDELVEEVKELYNKCLKTGNFPKVPGKQPNWY